MTKSSRAEALPKRSLQLQAESRVAQTPSDDKENWFYSEPNEVSFEHNKRFKYGAVLIYLLLQQ
jgi:hypothetical protein